MPLIILTLLVAVIAGIFAPRRAALIITTVAGALTFVSFAWAAADGLGDDPIWLLGVALVGCGAAIGVANALSKWRHGVASGA
jgi:hypothetical protein